jgi:hypothetical protein
MEHDASAHEHDRRRALGRHREAVSAEGRVRRFA